MRYFSEIDTDALINNICQIRHKVGKDTQIIAMVKANAYGHGSVEIAKILIENGASILAVANADEAIELRRGGINAPIIIIGGSPNEYFEDIIKNDIAQTVFSYDTAKAISYYAKKQNKTASVHIKIDTGMGRIGFPSADESIDEILKIFKTENISVEGVFTHFADADSTNKSFTKKQSELFNSICNKIEQRGFKIVLKHCSNSAGILDFDNLYFNAVRPGIILYGVYPSENVIKENLKLNPVMSLKSQIIHIKNVDSQTPISYNCTYKTKRESVIATIPVGYADGFIRKMQNGGKVIINGQFAPIVGRICMDQFMVDITDINDIDKVGIGSEVVIMGEQNGLSISASDIAKITETIPYEVLTLVGRRVPRVYIKNKIPYKTVNYINE